MVSPITGPEYTVTPADPTRHKMAIAQITADAFADGSYVEDIAQSYIGNCHYDYATTRLVWDGDKLVHHWGVWGYQMRLESTLLKVAGIGAVTTQEPYQRRGLMALASKHSFKAMHRNGYELSVLRGRHYVRFGYARAWNYVTTKLKVAEIPDLPPHQPYSQLAPGHLEAIIALYNRTHSGLTGTALRPTYRRQQEEDYSAFYGWFDDNDKLAGYLRASPVKDESALQCLEAAGDPIQVLGVLRDLLITESYKEIHFFTLHHDHPVLEIIRRGACLVENQFFHNTGWRVKVINLRRTLISLQPLLEERLVKSGLRDWEGELHLDSGEHQANIAIKAGKVKLLAPSHSPHIIQGGPSIGRLLIGSDEPEEIIQQEQMKLQGDGALLVKALFPNLNPVLSHWDEF